jgi:CRISPR/Cas system-associated protein Cas5 (RAMP superfamily)
MPRKRLRLRPPQDAAPEKRWLVTYSRGDAAFVRTFKDKDSAKEYADRCTKLGWTSKIGKPKP